MEKASVFRGARNTSFGKLSAGTRLRWHRRRRRPVRWKDPSSAAIPSPCRARPDASSPADLEQKIESSRCCSLPKVRWWRSVWTREELLRRRPLADCRIAARCTFEWFQRFTVKPPSGGKKPPCIRIFLALSATASWKFVLPLHCLAGVLCCGVAGSVLVLQYFGKMMGLSLCMVRFEPLCTVRRRERKWYCVSIFWGEGIYFFLI